MHDAFARILPIWLAISILYDGGPNARMGLAATNRDAVDGDLPRVILQRSESARTWRATYLLQRPLGRLRFQRPAAFYREDVWTIVTPGWSLQREGDSQLLVAEPGAETQRLVVEFPVHTRHIPKEYEFFASFTDGSVAIYTGHLYVETNATAPAAETRDEEAHHDPEAREADTVFLRRVELVPPPGARGVVHGQVFHSTHLWEDPHGDGTYVYFGAMDPIETPDMIAIIDRGAPSWIVEHLHQDLPAMFALYTEKFGERLPWKPMVLFSFDDANVSGLDSGGGTLTGLVQMSARGRDWYEETPKSSEQALYLIAHEAAHFWNGQLHSYEDIADSWMHEGSADAFASFMLHQQGVIDDRRLVQRRTKALNDCALGLAAGPLSASIQRGQFRNYYTCGEVISVWSAAALPGDGDFQRLFDVWRVVFDRSKADDGRYDRAAYFEALASFGVGAASIDALKEFVDAEHSDPAAALVDFMAQVDIVLQHFQRPALEARPSWAADVLRHLMTLSCNGRFSLRTENLGLRSYAVAGCAPFARDMFVVSIEGHAIASEGDLGYRAAVQRCARNQAVTLELEDKTSIRVPCTSPLPERPAPLAFPE